MNKVDNDQAEGQADLNLNLSYPRQSNPSSCPESEQCSENQPAPSLEEDGSNDKSDQKDRS